MPGMNSGINVNDPTVVAAFRAALLHQGLIAPAVFAVLSIAWVAVRQPPAAAAPPAARRTGNHPGPAGHRDHGRAHRHRRYPDRLAARPWPGGMGQDPGHRRRG